jgi:isoquinoline 1-oxidoreductase beta subunit
LKESIQAALIKRVGGSTLDLIEKEGGVIHTPTKQFYSYGNIVGNHPKIELLNTDPKLKHPKRQPLIGQKNYHLDTPAKTQGATIYTQDVKLPNMLYGKVAKPPLFEATIKIVDIRLAEKAPGVINIVQKLEYNFVGVVAKTDVQAKDALEQLKIEWNIPKIWQQEDIEQELDIEDLKSQVISPDTIRDEGDIDRARKMSDHHLKRSYSTPFGTHAAMETHAGVAHITKEKAEIWLGSQDSFFHQKLISKITGLSLEKINVHPTFIGGAFGGKVYVDAAVEAIHLKLVRVVWSREENFQHVYFRTPAHHQIEAGLTKDAQVS